jgi:hypothetical protein
VGDDWGFLKDGVKTHLMAPMSPTLFLQIKKSWRHLMAPMSPTFFYLQKKLQFAFS